MIAVQARVLAVESQKSILLQKARIAAEADNAGISIVGIRDKNTS
jgi:DUF1009 family protein